MPEIPVRPEALEAASTAYDARRQHVKTTAGRHRQKITAAIAAFCDAEGLTVETKYYGRVTGSRQRLVGPWRDVEEES